LHANYKLILAFRDDTGLQVSEMYVPGGKQGSKKEAAVFGLVFVAYTKPDVSEFGFTLGYLSPKTARQQFSK
jgi:hypothetical protein